MLNLFQGSIIGLAVGDALGTTIEFQSPGTFKPVTDIVGNGPFNLKPGEWTDDTSLALCIAESLIDKRDQQLHLDDHQEKFIKWYKEGHLSSNGRCFDIGNTTIQGIRHYMETGEPKMVTTDPYSAGNGSIMRLAPVPLFYFYNAEKAIEKSGMSSLTTHPLKVTVDACRYMGAIIHGLINGIDKQTVLSKLYTPYIDCWNKQPLDPKICNIANGSFKTKNPPEIRGTGYVVDSLEAALWAFYNTENFKDGVLSAVNLGDDADTTGAVFGQIAGAYYGIDNIPKSWVNKIAKKKLIFKIIDKLYETSLIVKERQNRFVTNFDDVVFTRLGGVDQNVIDLDKENYIE